MSRTLVQLFYAMFCVGVIMLGNANVVVAEETQSIYSVGAAAVDVTPSYPIRLNGFGNRRDESEGINQRIWAKALAIGTDEEKPVILITLDNLGIRLSMTDEVARQLKEKAGIERDRLIITFTHTHTAPKVNGASDTIFSTPIPPEHQAHIDQYTQELTDALVKVSLDALANRKPSRLERATGEVKFAMNRRPAGGPVDHSLPMLVVRSAEDNSISAIYVTYACHCVTLSHNLIGGDWAGYAQEAIQRNHPGIVAMVSAGCGSDSNPSSGVTGGNVAAAAEQGAEIANEVERLLKGKLEPITGKITATYRAIDLPLNTPPTRVELEAALNNPALAYNASVQLARLDRGESLQTKIDYPIQTVCFGDSLAMVFLGGEVCVDYKLRAAKEFDPDRLWMHGYSNDFCSYIPSERLLKEGGYGGGGETPYFDLPTTIAAGLENRIFTAIHKQLPKEFAVTPDDAATKITQLTKDLAVGTPAEYERIPEIWRIAIEAARRNDSNELRRLIDLSVPALGKPATDWQVVVYGGGVINGLTQVGVWPTDRISELVESDPELKKRCDSYIDFAAKMADDTTVRSGTRYDALRILGIADYARTGAQLEKYLTSPDGELQMGAVSGLGDIQADEAVQKLISAFDQLNDTNKQLAIEALLRSESRRALLKQALAEKRFSAAALSAEQTAKLNTQ